MTLRTCRDCQREFLTDARRCPHCGAKPPYRWTWWRLALAGFAGLVLLQLVIALVSSENQPNIEAAIVEAEAQALCKKAILAQLKAPSTAEFGARQVRRSDDDVVVVLGAVDAQNVFGAMLRSGYRCELRTEGTALRLSSAKLLEP